MAKHPKSQVILDDFRRYGRVINIKGREVISPWLNNDEAAAYINKSASSFANERSLGKGPDYHNCGRGRIVYHVEDLDRYMQKVRPSDLVKQDGED